MAVQYKTVLTGPVCSLLLATFLSGCSLLHDRTEDYVKEPEGSPLETPDNTKLVDKGEAFPIRNIRSSQTGKLGKDSIPKPPDTTSEILEKNYVVQELGGQTWVLVNEVPGRVWPSIAAYFNDRGLNVAYDNIQLGIVQSDVANFGREARTLLGMSNATDNESLEIVQARIAPGVRRKTTEIQLRVRNVASDPDQLLAWPTESSRPDLEKKLLTDLASYLKSREDNKSYSRAALRLDAPPRVKLISEGEQTVAIQLNVSYERAWAEVRRALDDAKIPVVDLDRSGGQFYVDFRSKDERDPGWFSWFSDPAKPRYTFFVRLNREADDVRVTTGRAPDYKGTDRSQRLLSDLFEYLY